jgi:uncharacterized membrane protein
VVERNRQAAPVGESIAAIAGGLFFDWNLKMSILYCIAIFYVICLVIIFLCATAWGEIPYMPDELDEPNNGDEP